MTSLRDLVSIVVLTHNRAEELRRTLARLSGLSGRYPLIVVDNASTDSTAALVRREFPSAILVPLRDNIGAAARNAGVRLARSPYVAFCDDDSWWSEGSLELAAGLLEAYPRVAAVCARILLGPEAREDPVCKVLQSSPLPRAGLPGPALLGFIACATVFRRRAFLDAGGYERRFFVGGEEELLSLDLLAQGWSIVYAPRLTIHHYPSPQRDNPRRRRIVLRNALWVAWLRLPLASALRRTWRICRASRDGRAAAAALLEAMREAPWVWRERSVMPPQVLRLYRMLGD
jgi:GT2 family glycosyltransferase